MKKYGIIYADPPWSYKDSGCQGVAAAQYPTMSVEDICKLPVKEAKPGQIVKNKDWDVSFVVLLNNTLKSINSDCSSIYEMSMNNTGWEIE